MGSETAGSEPFSLKKVFDAFEKSKQPDGVYLLDAYLDGYTELNKFFGLLGTVFGFVVSEMNEKIGILRQFRLGENATYYESVQSMVAYELEQKSTHCTKPPSGSRTLLRLHRALEFLLGFMSKIPEVPMDQGLSGVAGTEYNRTLSKHHPWLLRKTVSLALYTLPRKQQLLHKMGEEGQEGAVLAVLKQVVESGQPIYGGMQELYVKHDLLQLP